ncbi:MAG: T9SS type A sorting domain-containing protein [Perlabentimonas sp.]
MFKLARITIAIIYIITLSSIALMGQSEDGVVITTTNVGPYAQANSQQTIFGTIENFSTELVDQVTVKWSANNGEINSHTITNMDLGNWTRFLFEHQAPWSIGDAGEHTVKLWLDNINGSPLPETDTLTIKVNALTQTATRMVLLESFSSSNCASCADVNPQIRQLAQKFTGKMFPIGYQIDCYYSNPMCLMAEECISSRTELYGIHSSPNIVFNPWYKGNSANFNPKLIDAEMERPSPIGIIGDFSIEDDVIEASFEITPYASLQTENHILAIAYIQDKVNFDEPPGGNGETEFFHVLRKLNIQHTEELAPLIDGNPISINTSENFSELDLNLTDFRVGVFIQDTLTWEVIQAVELENLTTGIQVNGQSQVKIFPNPTKQKATLSFRAPNQSEYTITIINQVGAIVYSNKIEHKGDEFETSLPLSNLNKGVYIVKISSANFNTSKKLIIN